MQLTVNNNKVKLTNLDKVLWPEQNYTKKDLIKYYIDIYPLLKDYLKNRPLSLKIYPDGIKGKYFFQKNCPDYAPEWLSKFKIYSRNNKKSITWIIVNKLSDLVWIANKASIELHGWFSTTEHLDKPDFAVFDLDPGNNSTFSDTVETALLIKKMLDELELKSFVKTSGKTGLHIFIPVDPVFSYKEIQNFLKSLAQIIINYKPDLATIKWRKEKRLGKVYIDYRQNGRGKTIPAPYSLRPTSEATVSTPLKWSELYNDINHIKPENFNLSSIFSRIDKYDNLWNNILSIKQKLPDFSKTIR
ncbi:MAG: non-homologous end-joining DNA ligase [Bacillota bacterium]